MTQRERILAILVGGLFVAVGLSWGFGRYRDALRVRENRIASLSDEQEKFQEQQLQGAYAERQLGEYLVRSLPGTTEKARSDYQNWLLRWVNEHELRDPDVNAQSVQTVQDSENRPLFQQLSFRVTGKTDLPGLTELLHGFYAKDYLHRIRSMTVSPGRAEDDGLTLTMIVDAVSMNAAPADASPPEQTSWRVAPEVAAYRDAILNRNFFEPPNQEPRFEGRAEIEAIAGETTETPLRFTDPEGHPIELELAEEPPQFVELDRERGLLRIAASETGQYDLIVRATDAGYPNRTVEQTLTVRVNDTPPPREEPQETNFDDARLTVLTGLTEGRDGWTAWLNVRTQGKREQLRIGDGFRIGSVEGVIVDASPRHATIEAGGRQFRLNLGQSLAEAAKNAASAEADQVEEESNEDASSKVVPRF